MKKVFGWFVSVVLIFGMLGFAQAIPVGVTNLLQNASFEEWTDLGGGKTDFAFWSESGEWYRDNRAYDGSWAARIGVQSSSLYQSFGIASGDILYFGAYFRLLTNTYEANWDQAQINMQVVGLPDTTIGGSVSNFQGLTWNQLPNGNWLSEYFLVSGMIDLTGIALPANSAINISLQDLNPAATRVIVDAAYAGVSAAAVPEPSTMLLLGAGLLGLAGLGRKVRK